MANWNVAYNWMMDNEDAGRKYASVPDACPKGCEEQYCFAISGINSGAFPRRYAEIAATPQADRGPLVEDFYVLHFWSWWYDYISSDEVAKRVFDTAVNCGTARAVRLLQQAVNTVLPPAVHLLAVDGIWGPETTQAVNGCIEGALVAAFQRERTAYYEGLVAKNPALAPYLAAWRARAMR